MSSEEKRVREFAYQIWESEGKPEGQEARHWEMARKLAEAEALVPSKPASVKAKPKAGTATPKPVAKSPPKPAAKAPAKAADTRAKKPRAPHKPPAI